MGPRVLRRCYDVEQAASLLGTTRRALMARLVRRSSGIRRGGEATPAFWLLDETFLVDADSTDALSGVTPDPERGVWRVLAEPVGWVAHLPGADLSGVLPGVLSGADAGADLARERDARELSQLEAGVEREARIRADAEVALLKAAGAREEALALAASYAERVRLLEAALERLEVAHAAQAAQLVGLSGDIRSAN